MKRFQKKTYETFQKKHTNFSEKNIQNFPRKTYETFQKKHMKLTGKNI